MAMRAGDELSGRFVVEDLVFEGPVATLYRGADRRTGAAVALKVLRPDIDGDIGRFERECAVLAELRHPNIVRYVAHGVAAAGERYLATEWLHGEDLGRRLDRGPLEAGEVLALAQGVAAALAAMHARGIVHRDIKPANLFPPRWRRLPRAGARPRPRATDPHHPQHHPQRLAAGHPGIHGPGAGARPARPRRAHRHLRLRRRALRGHHGRRPHSRRLRRGPARQHPARRLPAGASDLRADADPAMDALIAQMFSRDPRVRRPRDGSAVAAIARGTCGRRGRRAPPRAGVDFDEIPHGAAATRQRGAAHRGGAQGALRGDALGRRGGPRVRREPRRARPRGCGQRRRLRGADGRRRPRDPPRPGRRHRPGRPGRALRPRAAALRAHGAHGARHGVGRGRGPRRGGRGHRPRGEGSCETAASGPRASSARTSSWATSQRGCSTRASTCASTAAASCSTASGRPTRPARSWARRRPSSGVAASSRRCSPRWRSASRSPSPARCWSSRRRAWARPAPGWSSSALAQQKLPDARGLGGAGRPAARGRALRDGDPDAPRALRAHPAGGARRPAREGPSAGRVARSHHRAAAGVRVPRGAHRHALLRRRVRGAAGRPARPRAPRRPDRPRVAGPRGRGVQRPPPAARHGGPPVG